MQPQSIMQVSVGSRGALSTFRASALLPDGEGATTLSDQKALNRREEQRWQREELRWATERRKHAEEGRGREVRHEKLRQELAVLQEKLAQQEMSDKPSRTDIALIEARGQCGAQSHLGVLENDAGDYSAKAVVRSEPETLSDTPSVLLDRDPDCEDQAGPPLNRSFKRIGLMVQQSDQVQSENTAIWTHGKVDNSDRIKQLEHPDEIIDVENLSVGHDVQLNLRQGASLESPSDEQTLALKKDAEQRQIQDGQSSSVEKQRKLMHFNEHAYVHNYLRHHHARWWIQTHGAARSGKPDSELSLLLDVETNKKVGESNE